MEQHTKNKTQFVFSDYLPVILMSAFFVIACYAPMAFGMQPSVTYGALAAAAACFYSLLFLGFAHYDTFFDAVFETVRTFATIIGLLYLFDGAFAPEGMITGVLAGMKSAGIAVMPWIVMFYWSFSSVLAGRRKCSKKTLNEAYANAEETLRHSHEALERSRTALERSDEILNHGKTGSANPA